MKRLMKNQIGQVKVVKHGFSWTAFFFGALSPLCRGDWKWFLIMLLANILLPIISQIIFGFTYNKFYIDDLLGKGYEFQQ